MHAGCRECQTKDWPRHKLECGKARAAGGAAGTAGAAGAAGGGGEEEEEARVGSLMARLRQATLQQR
jgi:hypothetical protein